jgi:hypothetical protein
MKLRQWAGKGIALLACMVLLGWTSAHACRNPERLGHGLEESDVIYYNGKGPAGGLAHIHYWNIDTDPLTEREKQKADRIRRNQLHSELFQPTQVVSGYEATGILDRKGRRQWITFKVPDAWNGRLVVCGTPGFRNEYANEAIFVPWLLEAGYAVISGNKGLESSWVDMLAGTHPTQHWGQMMHDMAKWASFRLVAAMWRFPRRIYAVGLSNGGYQVRRALEIDINHRRWRRLFDGGLDWSGTYFADARMLDRNGDGKVSVKEYDEANTLVGSMDVATLTMGWAYAPDTLTTPAQYAHRYPTAHDEMEAVGFNVESAIFWGYYNTNFDYYQYHGLPEWRGVGYNNLTSYVYRAELLGHDPVQSAPYSCFSDVNNPDDPPPLYQWLEKAGYGGWTEESIQWALANANTAEFKVPMITVVGNADGLLALNAHSAAYYEAVKKYGKKRLYRQYLIDNGPHVDAHADGEVDFDFNGIWGDEGAQNELTPMQAYAQRAFAYLVNWVERGRRPPKSCMVATDPTNDITDPDLLEW